MEIPIMISSAQIPQSLAGNGAADEAGMTPGRSGESSFFGLLFARAADGKEGSQASAQLTANLAPDGTAAATPLPVGNAVGRMPEQAAIADAQIAETGMKTVRGEAPRLTAAESAGQKGGLGVPGLLALPENAGVVQLAADGPAMAERGKSADSPRAEEADETDDKKGEKGAVQVPLFTAVIPLIVGNPARPAQPAAVSAQTESQAVDTAGVSTALPENPVQQTAGAEAGVNPAQSGAVDPLAKADASPDAGDISSAVLAKGGAPNGGKPGEKAAVALNQESDGKTPATAGTKAALPPGEGDMRNVREMLVSGTKGKGDETAHVGETGNGVARTAAEKATQVPGSRRIGEAAGNAYKEALEQAGKGNGKDVAAAGDSFPGKTPVSADAASAGAGVAPERAEIVAAAKVAARGEQGESPTRKTEEVKASTTIGVTLDIAQPRGAAESRSLAQAPPEKIPSAEQIVNQVREKLEATGRVADDGRITLKLHPQELGELKISMRLDDHNLKVEIMTQNPSVKEALMQNLDTLKETLSRQNIAMERFDVSADLRQGFSQGGRSERQMAQDNRGMESGYAYGAEDEEEPVAVPNHPWENDNSLVNLML